MRKPNLDDYDNGWVDEPEEILYPLVMHETKQQRFKRRMQLFFQIWEDRKELDGERYSAVSGKPLPKAFSTLYFDHLLERSKYPELEFEEENIILCTQEEHEKKGNGFPLPNHKDLIEKVKKRFGIL